MVEAGVDYEGISKKVMRFDIYAEALKELGVDAGAPSETPETLFDGITFDPKEPEKYATSFAIHNMKA
jgi:nitrate/nitrite transport system substrate-binding protein